MASLVNALLNGAANNVRSAILPQSQLDLRRTIVDQLDYMKTAARVSVVFSVASAIIFAGYFLTPMSLISAYIAYEFSLVAGNIQEIFENAVTEVTCRASRDALFNQVTLETPLVRCLLRPHFDRLMDNVPGGLDQIMNAIASN